jgi:hypothetical protein
LRWTEAAAAQRADPELLFLLGRAYYLLLTTYCLLLTTCCSLLTTYYSLLTTYSPGLVPRATFLARARRPSGGLGLGSGSGSNPNPTPSPTLALPLSRRAYRLGLAPAACDAARAETWLLTTYYLLLTTYYLLLTTYYLLLRLAPRRGCALPQKWATHRHRRSWARCCSRHRPGRREGR